MPVDPPSAVAEPVKPLLSALRGHGHGFVPDTAMRSLLAAHGGLDDWDAFAASWERMPLDTYMADGGRYRRRRHAVFSVDADGTAIPQPPQPHYQSLDYNPLNGGVARWYAPLEAATAASTALQTLLAAGATVFGTLAPSVRRWQVEVHPFRIEARADAPGQPTPEGMHRDGVDYVLVLLVRRHNIASGTTTIESPDGQPLGSFTLTAPFDAMWIDDHRVVHGVTPVSPLDPAQPAYRDVLVLTYRAGPAN